MGKRPSITRTGERLVSSPASMVFEDKFEKERWTLWFQSAENGSASEMQKLLRGKKPEDWKGHVFDWITLKNEEERTAFHIAAEAGHVDVLQLLASNGADVHEKDKAKETALHAAAEHNHVQAISWLLSQGVPIDAQSTAGSTALARAVSRGHLDAVRHLIAAKVVTLMGRTTLCTCPLCTCPSCTCPLCTCPLCACPLCI